MKRRNVFSSSSVSFSFTTKKGEFASARRFCSSSDTVTYQKNIHQLFSHIFLYSDDMAYHVEIKCQLDATDDFYCRSYCLLNMFWAPLRPSSGAREYYTSGCCLRIWCLVFKLSVWCGAEGCVSGLRAVATGNVTSC